MSGYPSIPSANPSGGLTQTDCFLQDVFSGTGSVTIPAGGWLNFTGFSGAAVQPGGTLGLTTNGLVMKFPPLEKYSQVIFSFRISGTIAGGAGTPREWQMQTRRADGITVVGSDGDVKVDGSDISNRDTALISWTKGVNDPFSVDGVQVGLLNNSGQSITLTSISVRVQRVVNPL